jgi:hypothetical protein
VPEDPPPLRNRKGCFIILAIVILFVVLYLIAGIHALPGNNAAQQIQTLPAS